MSLELEAAVGEGVSVELSQLSFDKLFGLSLEQVRAQPISINGFPAKLGEGFRVSGSTSEASCRLSGDCRHVHGVGARLKNFHLCIEGDVGDRLGAGMRGGTIEVRGNAGHFVAGANRGERTGMRGGLICVSGKSGQYGGFRMRRGTVIIGQTAEQGLAAEMIAGTILVRQPDIVGLGVGMRRGTVVVLGDNPDLARSLTESSLAGRLAGEAGKQLSKFSQPSPVDVVFRRLLAGYWSDLCLRLATAGIADSRCGGLSEFNGFRNWQRVIGDRAFGGLGEIWFEDETKC